MDSGLWRYASWIKSKNMIWNYEEPWRIYSPIASYTYTFLASLSDYCSLWDPMRLPLLCNSSVSFSAHSSWDSSEASHAESRVSSEIDSKNDILKLGFRFSEASKSACLTSSDPSLVTSIRSPSNTVAWLWGMEGCLKSDYILVWVGLTNGVEQRGRGECELVLVDIGFNLN